MAIATRKVFDEDLRDWKRSENSPAIADLPRNLRGVSVYVPCYNAQDYLRDVLSAIFSQRYPVLEVIVVDDFSQDASRAIAAEFPVKLIEHPENLGLSAARNSAISAAQGEFVAAIDSDTMPDVYWLERMMAAFESERVAGIAGRLFETNTVAIPDRWRQRMMPQHYGKGACANIQPLGCNSVYRKAVLQNLGGYNAEFRASYDDIDMADRVLKAGYETRYVPDAVCRHLRRDSLKKVLASCYSWRKPGYILADAYIDPQRLASKWVFSTKCDCQDLIALCSEGLGELAFVTLLGIFDACARDLATYYRTHNTELSAGFVFECAVLLLLFSKKLEQLSGAEENFIASHLCSVIEQGEIPEVSSLIPNVARRVKSFGRDFGTLAEGFGKLGMQYDAGREHLLIALDEILKLLALNPLVWELLHRSYERLVAEPAYAPPIKELVVTLPNVMPPAEPNGIGGKWFYTTYGHAVTVQECIEAIRGARAATLTVLAGEGEQELKAFLEAVSAQ